MQNIMESKQIHRKAIVAGHLCLDIIPGMQNIASGNFFQLFQPGRLIEVESASISTGGAASNTGLSLHTLGIPTKIVAKVGSDRFGKVVEDILNRYGDEIAEGLIIDASCGTSYTVIINPPGIDRIFLHAPAANDTFLAADINFDSFADVDLFHFGYPQLMKQMYIDEGNQLKEIYYQAKQHGLITSLDVTFPDPSTPMGKVNWSVILEKALPYVDIFCPSIEELLFMIFPDIYHDLLGKGGIIANIDGDLLSDISQTLLSFGVKIVLIKMGEKGLYLRTASGATADETGSLLSNSGEWDNQELWMPCFEVDVGGTTGAGDATIAGFLAAILRGCNTQEAVTMAAAVGACNVEKPDALSGVRTWEETASRIEAGWTQKPIHPRSDGWQWNEQYCLWRKLQNG